ncbi:MAG: NAD-glutamate dehydrogenase domain-containing protein, partial [Acidimicrobiales bacterium]
MAEPRGTETWGPAGWADDLAAELARRHRGGPAEAEAFARRVPASYREAIPPAEAADDMAELEALDGGADDMAELEALDGGAGEAGPAPPARFALRVAGPSGGMGTAPERGVFRLRRFSAAAVELSGFLPVIESFGLTVLEVAPHRVAGRAGTGGVAGRAGGGGVAGRAGGGGVAGRAGGGGYHVDDFSLRADRAGPVDHGGAGLRLIAALDAALSGRAEVDSLNGLVLAAGLDGREVGLFRAYRRYRRLAGFILPDAVLADALVERPAAARALLGYFVARFDPAGAGPLGPGAGRARQQVLEAIDGVDRLETYQALRAYLALVDATVRTNWFCADSLCPAPAAGWPGDRPAPVVLKFDSTAVPGLGPPRMAYEIFVHGPDLEGVHLRAGRVARGGIRWSDRHDDLRTEVAGLAAAQVKKNAIIVPTGAKGGFSCATGPSPAGGRRAYEGFVAALLQVTDNVVRRPGAGGTGPGHEVVAPPGVVRADGDDPYLVVAADRGTATFSDLANDVSRRYGFWLGDAFASGGASGYDHKAMGITARGVWTAVARHFRQLGVDVATDVLRVAGVGDMSGDVFGNAMLQSRSLLLVAAFDGRHVFLDPDPDPATSYQERSRLAHLAGSTWADYDLDAISAGGGVWSRDVAHVQLSQAATEALGLPVPVTDPVELVSAILEAPVDLLFFGGIGTYVKDRDEADADVGDHANDAVRVGADQLRARVVAEGGNLGITQRARARYSRRGGRINTDFVDNAAGVATSDREVNLKILLRLAEDEGRLDHAERDRLLASAQGDVVADVLRQVDHSVAALDRAVPESAADLAAYAALVEVLAGRAGLDRQAEALPDTEELARRSAAGAGLVRPELAVLLAYAKSDLVASILGSSLPEDPSLAELANG